MKLFVDLRPVKGGRRRSSIVHVLADRRGVVVLAYLALLSLIAVAAPILAPYAPDVQSPQILLHAGSPGHILGTDDLGRDVLSRLIYGTQVSLRASVVAVSVAVLVGFPVGLLAGYFGGWLDGILMRVVDTIQSFPGLILAVAITAALGPSIVNAMAAIGFVYSPAIARLIRAQVLSIKGDAYMDASRTFGASGIHLVRRHLLPNAIQPVIVEVSLLLARALIAEGSLSFLGLGAQPPTASWGAMLARAYGFMRQEPLQMLIPGVAIAVTALAFNIFGDVIQKVLDPRSTTSKELGKALPSGTSPSCELE